MRSICVVASVLFLATIVCAADAIVSAPKRSADGILTHEVRSEYESAATQVRLLLPDKLQPGRKYPTIYVLPVEAGTESHYGDGLAEVKKNDLANRFQAVFVAPTFSDLPWYADHPTNPGIRQETYFIHVVLPLVEKNYPVPAEARGRLLLGFSKSGWGAFSLLLRHPDLFGRAAAWDAPLMMDWPGKYGSQPIFGTRENFEQYQISKLLEKDGRELGPEKRLILMGYGNFRPDTDAAHALMERLKIPHLFVAGGRRKHEWGSGWLAEAVQLLMRSDATHEGR